jgi:2-keto-myo-inositol isomerase
MLTKKRFALNRIMAPSLGLMEEDDIPVEQFLNGHRILPGPADKMQNREVIQRLDAMGYLGAFSFEPFSKAVQDMSLEKLVSSIKVSLKYLEVN